MRTFTLIATIILLFGALECYTQCHHITFTRQGQIDSFSINYPQCTTAYEIIIDGEDITNLQGLEQLTGVTDDAMTLFQFTISNTSIVNLEGLNNIQFIESLFNLSFNQKLESTEGLNINLTNSIPVIEIIGNPLLKEVNINVIDSADLDLYAIDNLTLEKINIHGNNVSASVISIENNPNYESLDGFSSLTSINEFFISNNGHFEDFDGFNNVKNIHLLSLFRVYDYNLQTFESFHGFDSLVQIEDLMIEGVKSLEGLENISSLNNLIITGAIEPEASNHNMNGLENLKLIKNDFHLLNLERLNNVRALHPELIIQGNLTLQNNSNLELCAIPAFCNHLISNNSFDISNNGPTCNSLNAIINECDGFKTIPIQMFFDRNENGEFDANEISLENMELQVDSEQLYLINETSTDNYKYIYLSAGDHTISYVDNDLWELTTDSSTYFIDQDSSFYGEVLKFGFKPTILLSDISTFLNLNPPRCNTKIPLDIHAVNNGTTNADGFLWVELMNIDTICFLNNLPDSIISENIFGFNIKNLIPFSKRIKSIEIEIPGPPDIMIGDSFHVKSYFTFEDENGIATSDTNFLKEEIRCSYDPNDKLVNPKRANDNYTLIGQKLHYTVRFQNTGNAEAYDVIVRDTLDPNLDVSTFKPISSSHEEILQTFIKDDQYITFEFKNIFLPDSTTDFEGSNGYVSYTIEHNDGIDENTKIENTAHIYFDFNPPIVTNTTENIMVSMFPTSINDLYPGLEINIYPNPTDGILYFDGEDLELDAVVEIVDLTGKVVIQNQLSGLRQVNLHQLNSGVYFVHIIQENGRFSGKVVLE